MQIGSTTRKAGFSLGALRQARIERGITLNQVACKMGISTPQVQRIESGDRQLTVAFLEDYCDAMEIDILVLFEAEPIVPIMGVIDSASNVLPVPAGTPTSVRAPRFVCQPERLAGVRWNDASTFQAMEDYIAFFYADTKGIAKDAWGKRCILRRKDGTHRLGWPYQEDGRIHILAPGLKIEVNAELEWASPVLGVFAPETLE